MARARKKAISLESPDVAPSKSVKDAVKAFLDHCESEGLALSTTSKYRNTLNRLKAFCEKHGVDEVREITIDRLDGFRASRGIAAITSSKELQLLRQFCGYCKDRDWMKENTARKIKAPRNIQPNDVEPFTAKEVVEIIRACGEIGQRPYERLRARAMVLTLRYTALRIGDVALLSRDRITRDGERWRIFLRTEKTGKPVFLSIPSEMKVALDAVPIPKGCKQESQHYFWNSISSVKSMKKSADDTLRSVFRRSLVPRAHAHRFRHTLATELLGQGATFEEVADILGNSPAVVRKHYAKWSLARQGRIDALMELVHADAKYIGHNSGTEADAASKVLIN
jgi:integrase/recombinase XerC